MFERRKIKDFMNVQKEKKKVKDSLEVKREQ